MDTNKINRPRHGEHKPGIGCALFLLVLGGTFLLLNLGVIPAMYKPLLISWPMLLVVVGLWTLAVRRKYVGGAILTAAGLFFIYPILCRVFPGYFADVAIDFRNYWPLLLIVAGVLMVLARLFPRKMWFVRWHRHHRRSRMRSYSHRHFRQAGDRADDYIEKNILFGSSQQIVLSQDFKGGDVNAMFGELVVDLRKAVLAEGEHILEVNVMFGSILLYVPGEWCVDLQTNTFLASFDDKRQPDDTPPESASKLIVRGSVMFGNYEVSNG